MMILKIVVYLFKDFLFYFFKLFSSKVSQQSEWCLVYFFDSTFYYFWSNSFDFSTTSFDNLINSFFCNFIDVRSSFVNNTRSNFAGLIYYISAGISEIISIQKSAGLSPFFFASTLSSFYSIFLEDSYLEVSVS